MYDFEKSKIATRASSSSITAIVILVIFIQFFYSAMVILHIRINSQLVTQQEEINSRVLELQTLNETYTITRRLGNKIELIKQKEVTNKKIVTKVLQVKSIFEQNTSVDVKSFDIDTPGDVSSTAPVALTLEIYAPEALEIARFLGNLAEQDFLTSIELESANYLSVDNSYSAKVTAQFVQQ